MAAPVILAGLAIGAQTASIVAGHIGTAKEADRRNKAVAETKEAAQARFLQELSDTIARQGEERTRFAQVRDEGFRLARRATSTATVAAAEGGVAGLSVELLLGDIERQRGEHAVSVEQQEALVQRQLEREKRGAAVRRQETIAGLPTFKGPSFFDPILRIGAVGLKFAASRVGRGSQDIKIGAQFRGVPTPHAGHGHP